MSQDRAVHNARLAATALSRRRVEHESVELFLEALDESTLPEVPVAPAERTAEVMPG